MRLLLSHLDCECIHKFFVHCTVSRTVVFLTLTDPSPIQKLKNGGKRLAKSISEKPQSFSFIRSNFQVEHRRVEKMSHSTRSVWRFIHVGRWFSDTSKAFDHHYNYYRDLGFDKISKERYHTITIPMVKQACTFYIFPVLAYSTRDMMYHYDSPDD